MATQTPARAINEARDVLLDPARRAAHDRALDEASAAPTPQTEDPEDLVESWGSPSDWEAATPPPAPPRGPEPPPYAPDPAPGPAGGSSGGSQPPPYVQQPPPYPTGGHSNPGYSTGFTGGTAPAGPQTTPREIWRSATAAERAVTWIWVAISLVGPFFVVVNMTRGITGGVADLITYAVLLLLSLHVGWARITRARVPKRYIIWVGLSILTTLIWLNLAWQLGLYFLVWVATFVIAVEMRRRRLWAPS